MSEGKQRLTKIVLLSGSRRSKGGRKRCWRYKEERTRGGEKYLSARERRERDRRRKRTRRAKRSETVGKENSRRMNHMSLHPEVIPDSLGDRIERLSSLEVQSNDVSLSFLVLFVPAGKRNRKKCQRRVSSLYLALTSPQKQAWKLTCKAAIVSCTSHPPF